MNPLPALICADPALAAQDADVAQLYKQTLTLARTADDAPLQIALDRQMIAAGLLIPAAEQKLSPAWRHRLPATAVKRAPGDTMAIVPFGPSHVAVTTTGGTADCVSVTAFPLDSAAPLPRPTPPYPA